MSVGTLAVVACDVTGCGREVFAGDVEQTVDGFREEIVDGGWTLDTPHGDLCPLHAEEWERGQVPVSSAGSWF